MKHFIFLLSCLLFLNGCGGGGSGETLPLGNNNYSNLFAYTPNGQYNKVLKECASVTNAPFSCTLIKLPLLGQYTLNPNDQDILDRLLVSHQWMGDRFKEILPLLPPDIKLLFRSITTIVIDDDIRPSYYWVGTGAIHIDADYFWLTNEERNTISREEDPRANYGDDLKWINLERYTINSQAVYMGGTVNGQYERPLNYLIYPLVDVLYHELAHANDFAPPATLASLDKTDVVFDALRKNANNRITNKLYAQSPLRSEELVNFAKVRFHGKKATEGQKNTLGDYIGALFSSDNANRFYSYASRYEDTANLFTHSMMKYNYGLYFDTAFINKPTVENPVYSDYLVAWGVRNRVADPSVKPRAELILRSFIPDYNWDEFLATQTDTPIQMTAGENWAESLASTKKSRGNHSSYISELSHKTVPQSDFNMH